VREVEELTNFKRRVTKKLWETKTPGTLWATPGLLRDSFTSKVQKRKNYVPNVAIL
jgi:hypothetical protein